MTKFLLDSGDPDEYREISQLLTENHQELWGSTTNPTLIARKLAGQKVTFEQAFSTLQKQIVEDILAIVPGAVSAEVYASETTTAEEMAKQGQEIATWGKRVVVKLPTTIEGFKARTILRKLGICINNTLVFSQEQAFAITLHEQIMINMYGKPQTTWPCFISPFVGRLDDIGLRGMSFVEHSVKTIRENFPPGIAWMLEASIRNIVHFKAGLGINIDLMTVPAKVYKEWFGLTDQQKSQISTTTPNLEEIPAWTPSAELLQISDIDTFMQALTTKKLDIHHDLTDKGIQKFVSDWSQIIIQ